jgi:hypothetical protein
MGIWKEGWMIKVRPKWKWWGNINSQEENVKQNIIQMLA